ncbi:DUF192 domain-containing protein [Dyadobacter psychrotolerans]|uniref:DUF192 domain-containing protein n=1 Tax=Dyadobacter psychrotolerans TaxID=2541721 RepID=A0A4R5D8Y1_9BACT|nr:DUF192 domain-containing protein [Dyadobacter psychrotolerans]TDE10032.1 DUF192 domain-containing protein [Dyadobacter psychrotolerans]
MRNRQSIFAYILLAVFLLGGLAYMLAPWLNKKTVSEKPVVSTEIPSTVFTKEGEVVFSREGKQIRKIDVEIAENDAERNKGLMYRPYIPDSTGMLFIFQEPRELGFWMKNTQIPLDIIYADAGKKIISIQKNTKPFSEESLPSNGVAKYVVELNAGFSDRNDIKPGDAISF